MLNGTNDDLTELKRILAIPTARVVVVAGAGVPYVVTERNELARWEGLLKDGMTHPRVMKARQQKKYLQRMKEADAVLSGDGGSADGYIRVAQLIFDCMPFDEYRAWLDATVGNLQAPGPPSHDLIDALSLFLRRNHLIATTNYDNILSHALGLDWVTWRNKAKVHDVAAGLGQAILHIHGHFREPESIIFGSRTYQEIVDDLLFQQLLTAIGSLSVLVFIGCNAGLTDPNIGGLLGRLGKSYGKAQKHFIIARREELKPLRDTFPPDNGFRVIDYEETHEDLAAFLRDLLPPDVPEWKSSFVGRASEKRRLADALRESRLVVLTGESGLGKTRLAAAAVTEARTRFTCGVYWIAIGATSASTVADDMEGLSVAAVVANRLHLRPQQGRMMEQVLLDYLERQQVLVVLDDCEGQLKACADLAEKILARCPRVSILLTCWRWPEQEVIGQSVRVIRLNGLDYPARRAVWNDGAAPEAGPEPLKQFSSVKLFLARLRGDVSLEDSAPASAGSYGLGTEPVSLLGIARICRSLKGHPFFIEAIAGAIRSSLDRVSAALAIQQIAERLEHLGPLDIVFDRLPEEDKKAITRLSIFDGWTLGAAEAVCTGDGLTATALAGAVNRLLDRSLILVEVGTVAAQERFQMPDAVKRYLRKRKRIGNDISLDAVMREALLGRKSRYYTRLAESLARDLPGPQERVILDCLEAERANLISCLTRNLRERDPVGALRLVCALWRYWDMRGYRISGSGLIAKAISLSDRCPNELKHLRAEALNGLGVLNLERGEYEPARDALLHSLTLRLSLGGHADIAASLNNLGLVEHRQGHHLRAGQYFADSLAMRRQTGEPRAIASTLNNLGTLRKDEGNYEDALRLHTESVQIYKRVGGTRGMAAALNNLGETHAVQCHFVEARASHTESLALRRELNDPWGVAWSLLNLGHLDRWLGSYDEARRNYEQSRNMQERIGDRRGQAYALSDLGTVSILLGDCSKAKYYLLQSLLLREKPRDPRGLIRSVEAFALCAHAERDADQARWLYKAALELRHRLRFPLPPVDEKFDYVWPKALLREETSNEKKAGVALWCDDEDSLFVRTVERARSIAVGTPHS